MPSDEQRTARMRPMPISGVSGWPDSRVDSTSRITCQPHLTPQRMQAAQPSCQPASDQSASATNGG